MAKFNVITCGTNVKNTGVCDCFIDLKQIKGAIIVPKDFVMSETDANDVQAFLEGKVEASKADRVFPIQGLLTVTDGSAEPTFATLGDGTQIPVRDGNYDLTFQYVNGGLNLSNALRSFSGLTSKYRVLFIDADNTLIGTSKSGGLGGIPLEVLYPFPQKVNDGTAITSYRIRFAFQPSYFNEAIATIKVDKATYLLSELNGLVDIALTIANANGTTEVLTVTGTTNCGSSDLYDEYATELTQATAWVVKTAAGVAIAHTVTANASAKGWDIDYTAGTVALGDTVELAAPAVLSAAPINLSGYESDKVAVTVVS